MTSKSLDSPDALLKAVARVDRVLILPHNDPDPDAIASAMALSYLLKEKAGVPSRIVYRGIIGRAENKALVRYLRCPLRRLINSDFARSSMVALVDTQPGAGNNALPENQPAGIVLDHHPWRESTARSAFHDVRNGVGATSTILTDYLRGAGLELPTPLATALFYGIQTDTMGLSRGTGQADVDAYFYLQPRIDIEGLARIERAQVPAEYFQSLVAACSSARVYGRVLVSYLGWMDYPDLAAEMADLLLRLEGVEWVICLGAYDDDLIVSVRTAGRRDGAGWLVQTVVGGRGTAGGHGWMAGGQVPLGNQGPEQLALELSREALTRLGVEPDAPGIPILR